MTASRSLLLLRRAAAFSVLRLSGLARRALPALALSAALSAAFGAQTAHAQSFTQAPQSTYSFPAGESVNVLLYRLSSSMGGRFPQFTPPLPPGMTAAGFELGQRQFLRGTPTTPGVYGPITMTISNTSLTAEFTITITGDASAQPTVTASGTYQVLEDAATNTNVGNALTASDFPGSGGTWTITNGNTGNAFKIGSNTGQIQVAAALDHETTSSYTLTVQFAQGGETASTTVTVTVTNVNEAPEPSGTINPVTATAGAAAVPRNVSGNFSDPEGGTLTYTAASDDTAVATAAVSGSTVTITPVAAGTATVTVTATDPGGLTATQDISVTVNAASSPTVTASGTYQVAEDAATSTNVGNALTASDFPGSGGTWSITGGNTGGAFKIGSNTGQIQVAAALDHETTSSYTLTVQFAQGGATASTTVTVTVTNVNEAPTATGTINPVTATAGGAAVPRNVSGNFSDPEGGTLTYTAASDNTAIATAAVSGSTVTITPVAAGSATVTVTATDPGGLTATQDISITVNAAGSPTVTASGAYSVREDAAPNTDVGAALTASGFPGSGGAWSITGGNTGGAFSISNAGQIQVAAALDHETTPSYTLTVQFAQGGSMATASVTVTVTDVNEAPTAAGTIDPVTATAGAAAVPRNVSGNFSDPDGDALTYTAASDDTAVATTTVSGSTVTITPVAAGTATVTVTARDPGGLTATQDIGVTVNAGTLAPVMVTVDSGIAGDDIVNISERDAGFDITGTTEAGASVSVAVGSGGSRSATVNGTAWTVSIPGSAAEIAGTSVEVAATATLSGKADNTARRTLTLDLVPPAATYAAPSSLTVDTPIAAINPGGPSSDVAGYAVQSGTLPPGLVLNATTGAITGTPTAANSATAAVTIRLTDDNGNTGDVTITFPAVGRGGQTLTGFAYTPSTVRLGGTPPALTAPTVAPPPGGALSYSAAPGSVCTVDSGTGALTLVGTGACTVTATAAQTANHAVATATATVTVQDSLMLSITAGPDVDEGGMAMFTVTLSGSPDAGVTVNYATSPGTGPNAAVQADFTDTTGMLTFAAGTSDLTRTIMVPTADDGLAEGAETFTVTLTQGSGFPGDVALTTATATGRIRASDAATVSIANASGAEGGNIVFTVTLSGSPGADVEVAYETSPGTGANAAVQADFTDTMDTLTFAAETATLTQTITVPVAMDDLAEGLETFTVTLSEAAGGFPDGVTLGTSTATGMIAASDPAMVSIEDADGTEGGDIVFTVTLSGSPGAEVVVDYATSLESGDTAAETDFTDTMGTLTFAAETATLTQTITVPVAEDMLAEGVESFTVTLDEGVGGFPAGVMLGAATATGTISASDEATVSIAGGGADEGQDVELTVTLTGSPGADVVVAYATSPGSAVQADFTETTDTLTFAAGTSDLTRTITVPTADDGLAEGSETFTVTLSEGGGGFPGGVMLGTSTATGTINASDEATVSIAGGNADEGQDVVFTVTLSGSPGADVLVDYATSPGTGANAAAQADFTETMDTLTFAAGATGAALTQTVPVRAVNDALAEGIETFRMTLTAGAGGFPGGVTLGTSAATGTIGSSDDATVSIEDASGAEGGSVVFTVTLSGSPGSDVEVAYATSLESGDTAAQTDFTDTMDTLTFAAETTTLTQTITVPVAEDVLAEGAESFTVTLTEGGGGFPDGVSLGAATAVGTIEASDPATVDVVSVRQGVEGGEIAQFEVRLSGSPGAEVSLDWAPSAAAGETAAPGADFDDMLGGTLTFAAGATGADLTQTVGVPATDDDLAEGAETFSVAVVATSGLPPGVTLVRDPLTATGTIAASDAATVSIAPAGGSEGGDVVFTVTLSGRPGADVVVGYATSPGSAAQTDFTDTSGTLTFAAGTSTLTQTVPVPAAMDDLAEGPETFTVTLSEGGGGFPGGVSLGTSTAAGTIAASDAATVSIAPASGSEESGSVTFTVTLSGSPGADVEVEYATSPGSAVQADFTETTGTLTFATGASGGALTQTIPVPVAADGLAEGSESFTISLSEGGGGFPGGVTLGTATVTGMIVGSDAATVSIADAGGAEGGGVVFTVTLSGSPGADVEVDYATSPGSAAQEDFTETAGTLTFAAGTSALTQAVEVPTVGDDQAEGDETFTVTLTEGGGGFPGGVSLGAATATGTIRDGAEAASVPRLTRVNEAVQPQLTQAVAASTLSAITGRIDSVASGALPPGASGLAGKSDIVQALRSGERSLEDGTLSLEQLLGGSSFVLPLNAAEGGGPGGLGGLAVWGSGDYRRLSGPDDSAVEWDGHLFSFHIGADARVQPGLLAGLSVSRSLGSFDYTDRTDPLAVEGSYESRMTSLHPYVSWSSPEGVGAWVTVGYGWGEIEVDEAGLSRQRSDTNMKAAAVGASHRLLSDEGMFEDGTATLSLKGEGSLASVEVEGAGRINPLTSNVRRVRLALEGGYECRPRPGGCLSPSVEVGVRHDGGDGITGTGVELGGRLLYTDPASGLTVEGRGRVLVADGDGQEDWGVGGRVRFDPGAGGLGLSFDLAPAFGDAASDVDRLYAQDADALASGEDEAPVGRLDAELGYGIAGLHGVVTPYTRLSLADGGSSSYRVGGRLEIRPLLSFSLEGERRESGAEESDHGVMLRGRMQW